MEEEEEVVEDLVERMSNNVYFVERCINDWVSLLRMLKGKAKVMREEEQSRATDGKEGYVEFLLNSGEYIGRLKARLKQIQRNLDTKRRTPFEPLAAVSSQHIVGNVSSSGGRLVPPKLQLQTFDGNLE